MLPLIAGAAAVAGIALSIAGMNRSVDAARDNAAATRELTAAYQQSEEVRRRAMEIDASRRRRDIIRQSIIARSQALSIANAQGAAKGSGLQGAYGQIGSNAAYSLQGINQNEQIGEQMFDINRGALGARMRQADAGANAAIGQGLTSLGGTLLNSVGSINRLSGGF